MIAQSCTWSDVFDDKSRENLDTGFIITGAISTLLGIWLNLALLLTSLRTDLSYRNLTFFTVIACVRRAISVLSRFVPFNHSESTEYDMGKLSCDFFGFWDSFLAVYEVECLTHVCIERYVIAKYTTRGWPIQKSHYTLYQGLCVFFATLYSLPPLLGVGRYALDFSCQSCVLDMVIPETWERYIIIPIFLLRSVKSTGFMIVMLIWARNLESKYDSSENLVKELKFTNSVIVITIVNLLCWLPIAVIRGWVVLSYVLDNDVRAKPCSTSVEWAIWIHWISPAVTVIAMFLVDERAHQKMINICKGAPTADEDKKKE